MSNITPKVIPTKGIRDSMFPIMGYEPAEKGLARFRRTGHNLEDADIHLQYIKRDEFYFLEIRVNGNHIGSVTTWGDEDRKELFKKYFCTGKVTKAHIRIDAETVFSKNRLGKVVANEREKIYLFLKLED